MTVWQVQSAKAHFSNVIEKAQSEGPQVITRHGVERAVVLSAADYRDLVARKIDFKTYLLGGPKFDDFEIERQRDLGRPIDL